MTRTIGAGDAVTGLIERESEIRTLKRSLARLQAGQGGLVVLDAGAGLGKTALLRHARELAVNEGCTVLSARGAELEQEFTFGVVRQLFEPALPRDDATWEKVLTGAALTTAGLFTAGADVTGSLYPLLNGLYWLLVNLADSASLVLLVDDAQWGDSPSLQFLGFLARRLDSVAVLVIIATRAAEHGDDGLLEDILAADELTLLRLKSLSDRAITRLVRREMGPDAQDEFCLACHTVTNGNPLFVRELLRVLVADNVRPDAAGVASVEAVGPDAVRWYVAARLRRQPAEVRGVARAVAMLGSDTTLALVASQAGLSLEAATNAAETLTRQRIFDRADPPAFVHAIVRDVVLSLVPVADRSTEHERAAAVLRQAGAPLAQVASHLLRTTPSGAPERVGVLLAAAEQAFRSGSPEGAAVFLVRARAEPPIPALRAEISRQLGNCRAHHLALADAEFHLREALALADTPRQRAPCAYSLARFRNACGEPREAAPLLVQALDELDGPAEAENLPLVLETEAELIGVARCDLGSRAEMLRRIDSFERRAGRSDAILDSQRAVEAVFGGLPVGEALPPARSALAGDALTPERTGLWGAINTLMMADQLDEAERRMQRSLDAAVARGLLLPMGIIRGYLARIALLRGDLAQATEHVELGTAAVPKPNIGLPLLESTAVHLLIEHGRLAEADAVVESGVLAGDRPPHASTHLWLLGARTRLRIAQGDHGAGVAGALACRRLCERLGVTRLWDVQWRLSAAQAHLLAGQREQAADLVDEQLRLTRSFAVSRHIAVALRAAARLAGATDARRYLTEAVDLLRDGPARLEFARTLADLGDLLMRDGDRRTAREKIRQAAELALECHAPAMAERLSAGLAAGGGRPSPLRVSGVHALTPSERRVARLVADALTNRQIAERLFVSEKTVEAHLSRTFRKLGIRSRTQLVAQLAPART
ncbi:AAA family ATPase [Lentzea tibetensis]|uniref:AAA family ATPase n=1 Tax=Lentzea tibetensis TaxID=2591470 RepID=A0A563EW35_9PSEU|nr:LuxR family transcriptional regulator [Lentzea tibetensis]TWP51738.1 AAA family ATPase [Lentzea tibetensis]